MHLQLSCGLGEALDAKVKFAALDFKQQKH